MTHATRYLDLERRAQELEEQAEAAEARADAYRTHTEDEKARLAFMAIDTGAYSVEEFAETVGETPQTITRMHRMWERVALMEAV